jgi:hypothetical protein
VVHLRLVVPPGLVRRVRDLLTAWPVVVNVVHLEGASLKPRGDVILCDVAREDASVVIAELRALGLGEQGSIAIVLTLVLRGLGPAPDELTAVGHPATAAGVATLTVQRAVFERRRERYRRADPSSSSSQRRP